MDKNNDHVLIADDHEIIRYGLRSLLEANIPAELLKRKAMKH